MTQKQWRMLIRLAAAVLAFLIFPVLWALIVSPGHTDASLSNWWLGFIGSIAAGSLLAVGAWAFAEEFLTP